ncbi:c-type cytochrome [Mesorhizobium escarrei]|uniref:c-type cytochrome n=1 Tax=Mesorhizobium escarrei TaxID=666018 RepID=UPI003F53E0A9
MLRLFQGLGIAIIAIVFEGLLFLYLNSSDASSLAQFGSGGAPAPHTAMPHPRPAAAVRVPVPAGLETPEAVQAGAHLFRENCVSCHGAPGIAPAAQGMNPAPPNLLLAGRRNDPAEVFPKVKNGIPGTAMPAWSDQLPDQNIWSLAAFLHHSRGIQADAFEALSTTEADASPEGH